MPDVVLIMHICMSARQHAQAVRGEADADMCLTLVLSLRVTGVQWHLRSGRRWKVCSASVWVTW